MTSYLELYYLYIVVFHLGFHPSTEYQLQKEILRDTAASKMDNGGDSGNVIEVIGVDGPRNGANNWDDQAVWSPQDEYLGWDGASFFNDTISNPIYEGRQSEPRSASEPPNRKTINVPANGSTVMGKLFFKTRLCCKFRFGTCPNINNCSFAHSTEELRRLPQNWKEIKAASADPREEYQIPSLGSSSFMTETERYKGRHCKKFYTKEGCPYGDNCTYVHDEQYKGRERVAILLGPHRAAIGNGGGGLLPTPTSAPATASNSTLKHSNWKTRICNKWEPTAYCPYGNKCIFAHGAAELHGYGDGVVAPEANPTRRRFVPSVIVAPTGSSGAARSNGSKRVRRLDKITKINRIYGDWMDDTK